MEHLVLRVQQIRFIILKLRYASHALEVELLILLLESANVLQIDFGLELHVLNAIILNILICQLDNA